MKTVNRICQILAIVFGLVSLALFFMKFATVVTNGTSVDFIGAQLTFGGKHDIAGQMISTHRSAHIMFCFWLTVIGFIMSIFSFKSKTLRYLAPSAGLITGIYMLVISLSKAKNFVDVRPITGITSISYSPFVLLTAIALFVFALFGIAYLLIDDYIEVSSSKGKLTIPKRIVRFFRDYKSEIKKIVWPGFAEVAKNTVIVLIMCLVVGVLIWLLDYGLGKLLMLILNTKV